MVIRQKQNHDRNWNLFTAENAENAKNIGIKLKATKFRDPEARDGGGNEVTEGIGGIIAAEAFLVDVGFEHIGGMIGVVLEEGQAIEEVLATLMNEERGLDAGGGVAKALLDFGQALNAIGMGGADGNAEAGVMGVKRTAIKTVTEEVAPGGDLAEAVRVRRIMAHPQGGGLAKAGLIEVADQELVTLAHGLNTQDVLLGNGIPFSIFIHDEEVIRGIAAGEEDDGIVGETVIHAADPLDNSIPVEILDDMDVMAEGVKELAGGNIPVAIQPRGSLPAGQISESVLVSGIDELVIARSGSW